MRGAQAVARRGRRRAQASVAVAFDPQDGLAPAGAADVRGRLLAAPGDPVAGEDDRHRVGAEGVSQPVGVEAARDPLVGERGAEGNVARGLERLVVGDPAAVRIEGVVGLQRRPGEERVDRLRRVLEPLPRRAGAAPGPRPLQQRLEVGVVGEGDAHDAGVGGGERERAERRLVAGAGEAGERRVVDQPPLEHRTRAVLEALLVVAAVGADAFGADHDPLHRVALLGQRRGRGRVDRDVEEAHAEAAAEVVVGLDVGLVADRLRRADGSQDAEFVQLGEGRVDGAAAQLGDGAQRPRVDLLGREVLGAAAGEGTEDRPPLRGDAQRVASQQLAGIFRHRARLFRRARARLLGK